MSTKTIQKFRDRANGGVAPSDLTASQARVLSYILQCWISGFLPTHREVGEELGFRSPAASHSHCRYLEDKGYVEMHHGIGYQLTDKSLNLVL